METSQESQTNSEPRFPTNSLKPISEVEMAGILFLLLNDTWFLATLRSPHDAWYLFNAFLYVLWLIVIIGAFKYRWPAALSECPATPFPNKSDGKWAWIGWNYLFVISIGAMLIHPAITGIIAAFRWRKREYLKARQANSVALLIFVGYSTFSLIRVLIPS